MSNCVVIMNICKLSSNLHLFCRSLQMKQVKELDLIDDKELCYGLEYLKDNGT